MHIVLCTVLCCCRALHPPVVPHELVHMGHTTVRTLFHTNQPLNTSIPAQHSTLCQTHCGAIAVSRQCWLILWALAVCLHPVVNSCERLFCCGTVLALGGQQHTACAVLLVLFYHSAGIACYSVRQVTRNVPTMQAAVAMNGIGVPCKSVSMAYAARYTQNKLTSTLFYCSNAAVHQMRRAYVLRIRSLTTTSAEPCWHLA